MSIRKSEVFDRIKTSGFSFKNPDGSIPTVGSVFQTDSIFGTATFTQDMICNGLDATTVDANTLAFVNITGTTLSAQTITASTDITATDTSGSIQVDYVTTELSGDAANYLVVNNGILTSQKTTGKTPVPPPGDFTTSATTDTITNVTQWVSMLAPTVSMAPTTPDLPSIISKINTLLLLLSSRGAFITVAGPAKPTITGIRVDPTGFTASWTSVPNCTYAVILDDAVNTSSVATYSFTGLAGTNNFPYILKVAAIDTSGAYTFSDPYPVTIRNINGDPTDLGNFYGTFGQGPTSQAYYRLTTPNVKNYVILNIGPNDPPLQNTIFKIQGSNASPTSPIRFRYWNSPNYITSTAIVSDTGPHRLDYYYSSGLWQLGI